MNAFPTPSRWSLPITATVVLFLSFAGYLTMVAPLLEGQSAAGIPSIDPLGIFKSETPGQWISLFSQDAWQRDETHRNIITADGNILVFQDYHHQEDGTLKVSRLCLLLFDKDSQNERGEVDLDGRHYPTVVEAIDGAVLTFDQARPSAIGKYGELQEIRFLGEVQFWKESRDKQKAMFLQTRHLVVTGQKATTSERVQFRFGDSLGRANGLELVFENPDLQQTLRPALTRIEGISLARFQNIEHLELKLPGDSPLPGQTNESKNKPREVQLRCQGPAEFYFDELYANFHRQVQVDDVESGYRLDSHLLQVLFTAATLGKGDSQSDISASRSEFLPKGLTPQRMVAQGDPASGQSAVVRQDQRQTQLTAAQLTYDLTSQQFLATAEIPGTPVNTFPDSVRLMAKDLQVDVRELNYRMPPKAAPKEAIGQVWARGSGRMKHQSDNQTVWITWQKQMTLLDDRDMHDRKVISFYGQVTAHSPEQWDMSSDEMHFWIKQLPGLDGKSRFQPDLLLCQNQVRFQTDDMIGDVQQAKIYFPDSPSNGQDFPTSVSSTRPVRSTNPRPPGQVVRLGRPNFMPDDEKDSRTVDVREGPYIQAESLTVTLIEVSPPPGNAVATPSERPKYQPHQIQVQGGVSIVQARWDQQLLEPLNDPEYRITGDKITGVNQGNDNEGKPQFSWDVHGTNQETATVKTPQFQLNSEQLQFDQRANRAWSKRPGQALFPIDMDSPLFSDNPQTVPSDDQPLPPGKGSLNWNDQMDFDGKKFRVYGQVRCLIQQPTPTGSKQIQSFADQMVIELDRTVSFTQQDKAASQRSPGLKKLTLKSPEADGKHPVRLYQQEYDQDLNLLAQEIIWAPSVIMDRPRNELSIQGQGKLWSIRKDEKKSEGAIQLAEHTEAKLNYIDIQFERSLLGDLTEGQFTFSGPVRAMYGIAEQWQVDDPQRDLMDPVRLDCDTLVLNRWKVEQDRDFEMELNASGSVHILGQQYEALAERLNYNKSQDLLTVEGDARNAARFWQDNSVTGKRNHVIAQKIWYKPTSKWFNFEGLKQSDLTFAAGQTDGKGN